MIPRKISLSNFLSYGEKLQTIDFGAYSLMCLSGKNGNGKSALLDAMTWALWGQARKTSGIAKADAGLVRLGATRMLVSFDFLFAGKYYRVRREFAKTHGKPYASLDFEVSQDDGETFISLTDKTIRRTQEKIEKLLGLDFDTFVNSAFLRQGQANEFSKKSPKERKQILGAVLGLSHYDSLQQKALEKAREKSDRKNVLSTMQERDEQELAHEKELNTAFQHQQNELKIITKRLLTLNKERDELEGRKTVLATSRNECERLKKDRHDVVLKTKEYLSSFRAFVAEWRRIHADSLKTIDVTSLERRRKAVAERETVLRARQRENLTIQKELLTVRQAYQKRLNELADAQKKEIHHSELELQKHELALQQVVIFTQQQEKSLSEKNVLLTHKKASRKEISEKLKDQKTVTGTLQKIKEQFDKRKAYYQVLISRGSWIDQQLSDMQQKQKVLFEKQSPSCPTCEQMLTTKRRQFLATRFTQQEKNLQKKRLRIARVVPKLKQLLIEQHAELEELSRQHSFFTEGAIKISEFEDQCKELSKEIKILAVQRDDAQKDEKKLQASIRICRDAVRHLNKQQFDADIQLSAHKTRIALLEKKENECRYDDADHNKVVEELANVDKQLMQAEQLHDQMRDQQQRRVRIREIASHIRELQKKLTAYDQDQKKFSTLEQQEKILKDDSEKCVQEIKEQEKIKEAILQKLGSLENQKRHLALLKEKVVERIRQIKAFEQEAETYQTLAQAFGKNGIQALLIEEAIPEIEQEANQLIARLTDNQSQIFIESLRDLKKGGVRETLDIKIMDTAGIRPYEMFSGGEAFRIDFALRIAMSKLLARRAGTALQTLIIDEGFGSQDDEGLQHLMDALYEIRTDFSKIIVVSHLPALKENFPVHLVVEKGSSGSVVTVQERG